MKNPKISVIVPVYNNEKHLSGAVDSLVNQTYENMEIIIVNDGSVDKTGEVCDRYAKKYKNIKVIHQKNQGVSKARNAGLDIATGEFIGFCDSDDVVDRDYFQYLYKKIIETDSDIAGCCFDIISVKGVYHPKTVKGEFLWNKEQYIKHLFMGEVPIAVYDKLYKRQVIGNTRFPQEYVINEDKFFCFLVAMNSEKIAFESVEKYHYYRREGTASMSAFSEKYFDMLKLGKLMLDITKEKMPHMTEAAKGNIMVAILILYKLMIRRNGMKTFPEYEKEIYSYVKKFNKKIAKENLKRNDYIRFLILKRSKKVFAIFTKLIDKN